MKTRIARARDCLKGLNALLFTNHFNIRYLCGFTGTDGILVLTEQEMFLFVDARYTLQAQEEASSIRVIEIARQWEDVARHIATLGLESMGVESHIMDVDTYLEIKDRFAGIELTPLGSQLKHLRNIKDSGEIAKLRKAAAISEEALERILSAGLVGRREDEVAFDFEWEMRRLGAEGVSFELIIASGPRSAMPHGVASPRVIGRGEAVVIDFGCIYEGYCSDETITVFTGEPGAEFTEAYRQERAAQAKAIKALTPGAKASDIDALARGHLESKGYGKYFGHGLGHGVGLEVHEMPTLSKKSNDVLASGMVLTVEPGVYIPQRFGIRIEDTLVLTDNSCQRITNIDKDQIRIID